MLRTIVCCGCLFVYVAAVCAQDAAPKSLDPRLKIELFAEHPQIVTPTGIDVDHQGRVWVIESNTHFPPEGYQGHPSDRVLVMSDTDNDGRADRIVTFADGLVHTMSVAVRPGGAVYIATRRAITLMRDADGDGKADSKQRIVSLDTAGDYPHNGLAGFAFDAVGWMYFGFGENLGADYKIIGSDGTTLSGGAEGGNIYRCRLDGSRLTFWATGFWNPHASCVDAFGRLFSVDNDPDSSPPCRLLHIIRGGDYGYKFRNGRKGLHPFTSWNGEIPGTLPMVAGTGEAPSGIVAYESDGFPQDYLGTLLVGSWGDHRIDRFRLERKGASFTSQAKPMIVGGENFRPVGLAVAPDGSLYFTDWVLKNYEVHGKGRIWRVSPAKRLKRKVIDVTTITAGQPVKELAGWLASPRLEMRRAAAVALRKTARGRQVLFETVNNDNGPLRARLETLASLSQIPRNVQDFNWSKELVQKRVDDAKFDEVTALSLQLTSEGVPQAPRTRETDGWLAYGLGLYFVALHDNRLADLTLPAGLPMQTRIPLFKLDSRRSARDWLPEKFATLEQIDPFLLAVFIDTLAKVPDQAPTKSGALLQTAPQTARLAYFLASRKRDPRQQAPLRWGLKDNDPALRRAAVQWVAEEHLAGYRPQLEAILADGSISTDLFEATLAALEMLDGVKRKSGDELSGSQYVLRLVSDPGKPPRLRARALRAVSPADEQLTAKLLAELLATDDATLKLETVRTLQSSPLPAAPRMLRSVASDTRNATSLRAAAIVGLATAVQKVPPNDPNRRLLVRLLATDDSVLRRESVRSLRGVADTPQWDDVQVSLDRLSRMLQTSGLQNIARQELAEQLARLMPRKKALPGDLKRALPRRPKTIERWRRTLATKGDAAAGRRTFFHTNSAGCFRCHTVNGRGGAVGPDLSTIARSLDRTKLVDSILDPSKEVAPHFATWVFEMTDGRVVTGIILASRDGEITVGDNEGRHVKIAIDEIEQRTAQTTSLMPDKLIEQLTIGEFRDLIAFLETLK